MNSLELRAERVRKGLSTDDMARELGLNHGDSYSKKERGISRFKPDEIVRTAEVLGLSPKKINVIFFDGKLPLGSFKESD